jgi:carbon monoxide dehydrogenase subunit G
MRLSFSGAPEVAAALHVVWPRIVDPHFVARHGPGVESVEVLDPELVEVIPTSRLTMKARGRAPGSAVEITATLGLETLEITRTRLSWQAETEISGTVASVGARLMEGTARKLTEQFWIRFAAGLAEDAAPPAESSAPPTPTDPGPEGAPPNRVA